MCLETVVDEERLDIGAQHVDLLEVQDLHRDEDVLNVLRAEDQLALTDFIQGIGLTTELLLDGLVLINLDLAQRQVGITLLPCSGVGVNTASPWEWVLLLGQGGDRFIKAFTRGHADVIRVGVNHQALLHPVVVGTDVTAVGQVVVVEAAVLTLLLPFGHQEQVRWIVFIDPIRNFILSRLVLLQELQARLGRRLSKVAGMLEVFRHLVRTADHWWLWTNSSGIAIDGQWEHFGAVIDGQVDGSTERA